MRGLGTGASWQWLWEMGGTPMPGGWTLSGMWAPMCGQGWGGTAVMFLGMWTAMTAAMMAPSVAPALRRSGDAVRFGLGYLGVWALAGVGVFAAGAVVAEAAMREPGLARAMPFVAAAVVLAAGALQFSGWKARRLACCARTGDGWGGGLRLGVRCVACCAGPTAVLLALGVMNPAAMAAVTAAITLERRAADGVRMARVSGAVAVAGGLVLLARAVWRA